MKSHMRKLMTIVTESVLEKHLIQDIELLGVQGWTISDARGKGRRGVRNSTWDGSRNIRIEIICDEDSAKSIALRLQEKYYNDYAMIILVADIAVMYPQKFDIPS